MQQRLFALIGLFSSLLLAGCNNTPDISEAEFAKCVADFEEKLIEDYSAIRKVTIDIADDKLDAWQAGQRDEPPTLDILILSSGGPDGAFGAGVLEGWSKVEDPALRRPQFDRVTGISTGALMAPYAMVGTDEAYHTLAEFYSNPDPKWMDGSILWSVIRNKPSLFDNARLEKTLREAIDADMLNRIGERTEENALLLVGATNMDLGRFRIFDLTQLAKDGDEERFEDIMLASAAIPGVFPPVVIDNFSYGDGGAKANLFLGVDRDLIWRKDAGPWWNEARVKAGSPKLRVRHWIIVNGKLQADPSPAPKTWSTMGTRAISQMLRAANIRSLQQLDVMRRLSVERPDVQFEVYWVAIPPDYELPEMKDGMFDKQYMRELVELGRKMGSDPSSWQTESPLLELDWDREKAN
ncbi:MAG: patatin-like phospholipase family protein [Planctomycetota bacterium]